MAAASSAVLWITHGQDPPVGLTFGPACEGISTFAPGVANIVEPSPRIPNR